jgi:hypothetical protein
MAEGAREAVESAAPEPAAAAAIRAPEGVAPTVAALLALQRSAGNAAVTSLLRKRRLARAPMPGFSQKGDTCGAASLVTALFLWDLDRPNTGNTAVVHACDLVLTANDDGKANKTAIDSIKLVRESAMTPGTKLGQTDYEVLGMAFALLYNGRAGMSAQDISKLARALGFRPFADGSGATLAEILASDAVTKLQPGEVGQLNWIIASTGGGHAMLLGRREDGKWFFSDQGVSPPKEIQTDSPSALASAVVAYSQGGWLYAGNKRDLRTLPPVTGFQAMTQVQRFLIQGPALITPGEDLAEIDADYAWGEVVKAWDYRSRHETLADAKAAITGDPGGHGGVIVERPRDMFHIYKTNPIKGEKNLKETKIDTSDSSDMVLVKRVGSFYSAWVVLSDAAGKKGTPFAVKP